MRYLGSKDRLVPEILSLLVKKGLTGFNYTFFDAFCGTGAVANSVKDIYHIIINDAMTWSVLYAKGRIVGNKCTFEKLGFNPFQYFEEYNNIKYGFFYTNYSPGGSDRMYFSPQNAGRIDFIRCKIEEWREASLLTDDEYSYLLYSLIEGISSISNTAGVYGAFLKHWDPRALNDLHLEPINIGLFDNTYEVRTYCAKVEDIIEDVECDILYLDPPYTQNQYGTQYHILETLVLNDNPSISKITGSRPVTPMKSLWSQEDYAKVLLDRVIAKTKAKYIILSYNNDGLLSKEFIEATFKRYGREDTYSCQEINYKKYNNFKCREKEGHLEYLFFIEKKDECDIIFESPLNYSGSKAKMLPLIKSLLPNNISLFVDAFGGGFNVGINISASKVIYNDINPFVMHLIQSFRDNDCIDYLKAVNKYIKAYNLAPNHKDGYNTLRDNYNDDTNRSPIMLYTLILFGYQQQIRFNSEYRFNIPCGSRHFNDRLVSKFISFSRIIKNKEVEFRNDSFADLEEYIKPDTFFYFDPPYRETTATYNDGKRGFEGWTIEHERKLCHFMDEIHTHNGKFMFSYIIQLGSFKNYEVENWAQSMGYKILDVKDAQGRYNNRKEVLIINY